MKEALLKKRSGIPAALLLVVLLLAGTALAWYGFKTVSSGSTVEEPLSASTSTTTGFSASMYPGETNTWDFDITNSANVGYDIKADLTYSAPSGVSITDFTVIRFDMAGNKINSADETGDLLDDGSATFDNEMPANGKISCSMTISADKDATPGDVLVSLALSRG